jgi:predicted enzyme related to lactoylglutathione lyase
MATIVHFDVPADDPERAKKFYAALLGWKFDLVPQFQYNLISTTNIDGKPGVGGGLGKRMGPSQRMMNYFGVKSIDATMKQVEKLGGKLVSPKMPVPGMGWLVNCMDTEGNSFGLWEENKGAK